MNNLKRLRSLVSVLAVLYSIGAAGQDLPTADEVAAITARKICYDLQFRITRLSDRQVLPDVTIPICHETPALNANPCEPTDIRAYYHHRCVLQPIAAEGSYLSWSTAQYTFDAFVDPAELVFSGRADDGSAVKHCWLRTGGLSKPMWTVRAAWSSHLKELLSAHAADFPFTWTEIDAPPITTRQAVAFFACVMPRGVVAHLGAETDVFDDQYFEARDAAHQTYGVTVEMSSGRVSVVDEAAP